jgi:hypothetical protein
MGLTVHKYGITASCSNCKSRIDLKAAIKYGINIQHINNKNDINCTFLCPVLCNSCFNKIISVYRQLKKLK